MKTPPRPEFDLLLLSTRWPRDEGDAERICGLLRRDVDWDRLLGIARRHGLVPMLYRMLAPLASSGIPIDVLAKLRFQAEAYRLRNLVLVSESLNALRALEAAGIIAMPYKGPALAAFLYGDFFLRQSADIDLLVRPCDAVRARHVLLGLGYVPNRAISERMEPLFVRLNCEFAFTIKKQVVVELNWRVSQWFWRLPEIPPAAWDRAGRLSLAGTSVPWFSAEDLLIVLCLHGSKHKWDSLKWIVDIAQLLRNHPDLDWREITDYARKTGAERMLALGLFLANDLLGAPLPSGSSSAIQIKPSVVSLAEEVYENLLAARSEPAGLMQTLPFLARIADRLDTRLVCRMLPVGYFLVLRILRPGMAAVRRANAGG